MLAFASSSSLAFNPVHAVVTKIAEISIVGHDKRALDKSIADMSPLRAIDSLVSRAAERASKAGVFMVADARPKIVGDMGFDPLNIGTDDNFAYMREAEIKHGRLAMLAAVAWPLQEILHPILVDAVYDTTGRTVTDVLIESNGASPSLLNGGLFQDQVLPALLLFTLGCAALEERDLNVRKATGDAWNAYAPSVGPFGRQPGNFGFDPLNFYKPLSMADKVAVQEKELLNGRVAMMAVASYVTTEFVTGMPTVRATPLLFEPIILAPWFRSLMDTSFGMASMDGSIEGIAY